MKNLNPFTNKFLMVLAMASLLFCCSRNKNQSAIHEPQDKYLPELSFIKSPVPGENIPYSNYQVSARKSTELIHTSGTKIKIPANAFVDQNGNPVKDGVTIQYREMHNSWDIFVSGIPMTYNHDSVMYHFESAGMFDIQGTTNGEPVFVAKGKNIHVEMASRKEGERFNNYYLDTVNKTWVEFEKSKLKKRKKRLFETALEIGNNAKPLKPRRADSVINLLTLLIENRKDFPQFDAFENLKFEVVNSNGQYRAGKVPLNYSIADIIPAEDKPGFYYLNMMYLDKNKSLWINWLVRPAYDRTDYEKSLQVYNRELEKYRENEKRKEQQRILYEKERKSEELLAKTYRDVNVNKFGIYNSDSPLLVEWQELSPAFTDKAGKKLEIHQLMVFDDSINGVIRYNLFQNPRIKIKLNSRQKLIGITDDTEIYACYANDTQQDFTTGNYTIKLQRYPNSEELKSFVTK